MICGINTIMKAISLTSAPWWNKPLGHSGDGWNVTFDENLMSNIQDYGIIRDWLIENIIRGSDMSGAWSLTNSTTITFANHTDAMLCYIKFSAGVYE